MSGSNKTETFKNYNSKHSNMMLTLVNEWQAQSLKIKENNNFSLFFPVNYQIKSKSYFLSHLKAHDCQVRKHFSNEIIVKDSL